MTAAEDGDTDKWPYYDTPPPMDASGLCSGCCFGCACIAAFLVFVLVSMLVS